MSTLGTLDYGTGAMNDPMDILDGLIDGLFMAAGIWFLILAWLVLS
jgi:hypothetical protein